MQASRHAVKPSCGGVPEGIATMTAREPVPEIVAGDTSVILVADGLRCTGGGSFHDVVNATLKQFSE